MTVPPITEKHWTEEVKGVLAAAGLPWQIGSCWCDKTACAAEVINRSNGKTRLVTLSLDIFPTAGLRKAELVRLLQANYRGIPTVP